MNIIVTEETELGEVPVDIYTKLANDRILFLHDYIDDKLATDIVATLLLKDAEDNSNKISLFINSEGGDIRSVFMIYDTIQMLQSPIETICMGSAMDEVVLLLAAGSPGLRYATQNSAICPTQLIADKSFYSSLTDAKALMERFKADNKNYMQLLAKHTGKNIKDVMINFERKKFFGAKQALKYGIIDGIIESSK